jgi:hypothetical protein
LYAHGVRAAACAVAIAKMSRAASPCAATEFVAYQTHLAEHLRRIDQIPEISRVLAQWPQTPGVTFSWKSGTSHLDVAVQFAKMINVAALFARGEVALNGETSYDALPVSPVPHSRFDEWRDKTLQELLTRQLPIPDVWPAMAEIHKEYGSLGHKMNAEFEIALQAWASGGSAGGTMPKRQPVPAARRKAPDGTEAAVLLKSKRRCCLCYGLSDDDSQTPGQLAHIDRDPCNSDESNLAFLCLKHHDEYDTRTSQSKGLTPDELRHYRDALYAHLAKRTKRRTSNYPDGSIGAAKGIGGSVDAPTGSHFVGDNNVIVGRDLNINSRKIQRTHVLAGPDCILDSDALKIRTLIDALVKIDRIAGRDDTHSTWYTKLYRHFKVTSYKLIPASRAMEAIEWLQRQKAINRPKLRRRDNVKWRNSLYKGIWARAKQLGMQKADVYNLALERLHLETPICSLKEIGERDLEKLNQIIMRIGH